MSLITKADIADWMQLPGTAGANIDDKKCARAIKEAQDLDVRESLGYPLFNDLVNNYGNESLVIVYTALANGPFVIGNSISGGTGKTGTITDLDVGTLTLTITITAGDWSGVTALTSGSTTATVASKTFGKYYYLMNGETYTDPSGYSVAFQGLIPVLCYYAYARIMRYNNLTVTATGIKQKKASDHSENTPYKAIAEEIAQLKSSAFSYLDDVRKYLNDKNNGDATYPLWNVTPTTKRKGGVRLTPIDVLHSNSYVQTEQLRSGGAGSSVAGWTVLAFSTTAATYSYTSATLQGKTIQQVQLDNIMLTPDQYLLSGTTFSITDAGLPISSGTNNLRISYT